MVRSRSCWSACGPSALEACACQDYNRQTRILEVTNVEDFETYTAKRLTDTQSQMKWGQVLSGGPPAPRGGASLRERARAI